VKRRRIAFAILLMWPGLLPWFTAPYFTHYYTPWGWYFHQSAPCYGVGCPNYSQGKNFHYPKH
jgi:hypothetical protein